MTPRPDNALRGLLSVALIIRRPTEWLAYTRDVSRVFGDALAGALGEPPRTPRSPVDIWLHPYAPIEDDPRPPARVDVIREALAKHKRAGMGKCRCGWVAPHDCSVGRSFELLELHIAQELDRALDRSKWARRLQDWQDNAAEGDK